MFTEEGTFVANDTREQSFPGSNVATYEEGRAGIDTINGGLSGEFIFSGNLIIFSTEPQITFRDARIAHNLPSFYKRALNAFSLYFTVFNVYNSLVRNGTLRNLTVARVARYKTIKRKTYIALF